MSYIIVHCTIDDKNKAKELALGLIEHKLAACVSLQNNVESFYEWKGKIECEKEILLLIKTKQNLFVQLKEYIEKNHPYDLPQIIATPIENGNNAYFQWIQEQTKG